MTTSENDPETFSHPEGPNALINTSEGRRMRKVALWGQAGHASPNHDDAVTKTRGRVAAAILSALLGAVLTLTGTGTAFAATDSRTPDVNGFHLSAHVEILRWEGGCNGMCVGARIQAYSRFERQGGTDRKDADYLAVSCRDDGGRSDSDSENGASKTTVTYTTTPRPYGGFPIRVTCTHTAREAGFTYTTTTDINLTTPLQS